MALCAAEAFNADPFQSRVYEVGGDVESCFTNIDHCLIRQSWDFYKGCLSERVPGISTPRSRSGKPVPFIYKPGTRGIMISFTLADIQAVVFHHLDTAWLQVAALLASR